MNSAAALLKKYRNAENAVVVDGADFISQKGYTLIPSYVLHTNKLSAYSKLVYTVLLSYAWGDKNTAFPSQQTLADACGISERSVRGAIKELQVEKFVTIIRRGVMKTNVYVLHFKRK